MIRFFVDRLPVPQRSPRLRDWAFVNLRRVGGLFAVALAGLLLVASARAADPTWNYAVQVSATVSDAPPWAITLSWPEDTGAGNGYAPAYTLYRKDPASSDWGAGIALDAGQTTYVDTNVAPGVRYEYQVVRQFRDPRYPTADHDAYGYLLAGINVPLVEHRGRVILVVEDRVAAALPDRVARLRADLVGDGWAVTELTVSTADTPAAVRQRIIDSYFSTSDHADVVFLLGHVPVAKSGNTAPDGHEERALPCDAFYGDVGGEWVDANGDGVFENDTIPSPVEMEVGRVDFADMAGLGTGLDDLGLTARYLDKDHAYRTGQLRFAARGVIGDRVGVDRGRAPAAGAYRAFSAFFGAANVVPANTDDGAPANERWLSMIRADSYTWAFGSGGGGADAVSSLGTQGDYATATSADLATDTRAAFYLMFGSYFVNWAQTDDLLRAALASPTGGLGAAWSGRPSFILHHFGLGETIGYDVRLTQNNDGFYFSPTNAFRRGVHIAWLGDPTLRLTSVAPVTSLTGSRSGGTVTLAWQASADAATHPVSYLVYRAASPDGPYTRLTADPVNAVSFTDSSARSGATYLVRAVMRQTTASGTFDDASVGAAWTDSSGGTQQTAAAVPSGPVVHFSVPVLFTPPPTGDEPGPRRAVPAP